MSKSKLIAVALCAVCESTFAQQPPTGGGQLLQIPPVPAPERSAPEIDIEKGSPTTVPADDHVKVLVNSLQVTGAKVYPESVLIALTGFEPGRELTLVELRLMASKIADHYHKNGYFVAKVYLPAQDIRDGAVTFTVIEGEYGTITLRNQTNLSDGIAGGLLEGLAPGDTIAIAPLETRLLLLSDIPGVLVRSTLIPGASVGTSDLIVDVTPGRRVTGSVEVDNGGDRYTGAFRVGGTVNVNNPTGRGDVLSLRVLSSGSGLVYGRASYQLQVGRGTMGVAYTALRYELGKEFESLDAHGTAQIASIFGSYPLIRSRTTNLYAIAGFDAKTFEDRVDATSIVTDKKVRAGMAGFYGNHRDGFGGGGFTTFSVTGTAGQVDIETPAALAADQASVRTNGGYGKLGFTAARLQNVTRTISLYGSIYGQAASENLDISEKMVLGGPYGVRAYPVGETYADEGVLATLEVRVLLPKLAENVPGQMHAIGFVDSGRVAFNHHPWAPGPNHRTLSGAGVGISWTHYNNFAVRAYYAHKLGNAVATSGPDSSGRFWIQAVKYF